jgi:hypothetical protein
MRLTFSHIMNLFLLTEVKKYINCNKETNLCRYKLLRFLVCGKVKCNVSSRKGQFSCCQIQESLRNMFRHLLELKGNKEPTKFLSFATFTNLQSCDFFRFQDTDNSLPDGTERGSVPMTGGVESTRRIENSILLIDDPTILVTVPKGTWRVSNFPS